MALLFISNAPEKTELVKNDSQSEEFVMRMFGQEIKTADSLRSFSNINHFTLYVSLLLSE